jgi:endonuclease YncB( thermonuclease family)
MKKLLLVLAFFVATVSQAQNCRYEATVVRCMDGDTFDANVSLGFKIWHIIRVRLAGMNAPEMKGVDSVKGRLAKEYLESLILGKLVYFPIGEKVDLYGRFIEVVYPTLNATLSVNQIMIATSHAEFKKY